MIRETSAITRVNGVPVNKLAAVVAFSKGIRTQKHPVNMEEVKSAHKLLHDHRRVLAKALKINSKKDHKQLIMRFRKARRANADLHHFANPELVLEYVQVGTMMEVFHALIMNEEGKRQR